MGCETSSQIQHSNKYKEINTNYSQQPLIALRKPQIWFINGDPGSNKRSIIQQLAHDYKYKYIPFYDIFKFQQNMKSPQTLQMRKLIKQKKNIPYEYRIKLLSKCISALGDYRYLFDGFLQNYQDIQYFQKYFNTTQIDIKWFIQIQLSDQKIKASAIQVKLNKNNQSKINKKTIEQIEKQVDEILMKYKKDTSQVVNYFSKINKLIRINVDNSTIEQAYRDLRIRFAQLKVRTIQKGDVKIIFSHFDNQQYQQKYVNYLRKVYGFYCIDIETIIKQIKENNQIQIKQNHQGQDKKYPLQLYQKQLTKIIQSLNYKGIFYIIGYPFIIQQAQQWNKCFRWSAQVYGFVVQENLTKQKIFQEQYTLKYIESQIKQLRLLCDYFDKQKKLFRVQNQVQSDQNNRFIHISKYLQKQLDIRPRYPISNKKIVFVSTLNHKGNHLKDVIYQNWKIINMNYFYQAEVRQQRLYCFIIHQSLTQGKPIPSQIAVKVLLKNLHMLKQQNVIIKGFPNSSEQLIRWEEQVGGLYLQPKILYYQMDIPIVTAMLNQKKQDQIKLYFLDSLMFNNYLLKFKITLNSQRNI